MFYKNSFNDGDLSGRDPLVAKHHKTLHAEDPDYTGCTSYFERYDNMRPSMSPIEGRFEAGFDAEILAVCLLPDQSVIVGCLAIRSDGRGNLLTSVTSYDENEED